MPTGGSATWVLAEDAFVGLCTKVGHREHIGGPGSETVHRRVPVVMQLNGACRCGIWLSPATLDGATRTE